MHDTSRRIAVYSPEEARGRLQQGFALAGGGPWSLESIEPAELVDVERLVQRFDAVILDLDWPVPGDVSSSTLSTEVADFELMRALVMGDRTPRERDDDSSGSIPTLD